MEEEGSGEVFNTEIVMVNSWNEKANISQLCRICANSSDCLISIFEGEGIQHELSLKINKHLPLKVTLEDKLPKNVCYPCASTLIAWHDMSISCIEADKKLHSLICDGSPAVSEDEFCDANSLDFEDQNDSVDIVEEKVVPEPPPPAEEADELEIVDVSVIQKMASSTSSHVSKIDDKTVSNELFTLEEEKVDDLKVSVEPEPENVNSIKACEPSTSSNNTEHTTTENVKSAENKNPEEGSPSLDTPSKNETKNKKTKVKTTKCADDKSDGFDAFKKVYQCDKCSLRFEKKCRLLNHLKVHSDKKDYICHICAKPFHRRYNMKLHIERIHLGLKNHVCDICGQGFADKYLLKDHRRRHTGEKPFICDVCGKSFISFSSIRSHRKTHKDEFPYPCNVCGHKFRFRQNLREHVSLHTNEKKYFCDVCGQWFRQSNSLNRHKLVHTDDKPFPCTLCSLSFKMMRYLKRHMKSKHNC